MIQNPKYTIFTIVYNDLKQRTLFVNKYFMSH